LPTIRSVGSIVMHTRIAALIVWLALVVPVAAPAADMRPRSILLLDQADPRGSFYYDIFLTLRERVSADLSSHIALYRESFDFSRFNGPAYEQTLREYLKDKYRDRPIGVIIAIGAATLQRVQCWHADLWPGIPVVFGLVDESDLDRLKLPPDVTGGTVRLRLADSISAARAEVPDLNNIVLVGDDWNRQAVFYRWKQDIGKAAAGLRVTELVGLTMTELRKRVAALPAQSAIIYSAIHSDGEGGFYPPAVSLGFMAEKANRPIIVAAENYLESGGLGGFVLQAAPIGADAARRALRIIEGEAASSIPVTPIDAVKPVFNWRQMRRWNVSEDDLPAGSEIRFREPSVWERYRWQSMSVVAAILIQAALISILLHERKRRDFAEAESRQRMSELAHVHRQAIAGELSSSIAHELNQPLGSILTNAETAEMILRSPRPDLGELKEIVADIREDDLRASQVITHMRSLLKKAPFELIRIDVNQILRETFDLLRTQAAARNVALYLKTSAEPLWINGDRVQLQQVLLNLIVNSMDAMEAVPFGRIIIGHAESDGASALIAISDSGPGIPTENLSEIFDPFFTTKEQGVGIGLSIARTIVQAHKGRIAAENQPEGGATFRITLPLAA
jgi:signal transduction histidine kinase